MKKQKFYTGIGSRKTPISIQTLMSSIAERLYYLDYTLRSGAAEGADWAFENGHDKTVAFLRDQSKDYDNGEDLFSLTSFIIPIKKEIYIPWNGFEKHYIGNNGTYCHITPQKEAYELVSKIHPAPHNLSDAEWKFHMRNCNQVLGYFLNAPSDFVICWTRNGKEVGGTRTAMILAKQNNIPVYNLFSENDRKEIENLISRLENEQKKASGTIS